MIENCIFNPKLSVILSVAKNPVICNIDWILRYAQNDEIVIVIKKGQTAKRFALFIFS